MDSFRILMDAGAGEGGGGGPAPEPSPAPEPAPKKVAPVDSEWFHSVINENYTLKQRLSEVDAASKAEVKKALEKAEGEWKKSLGESSEAYATLQRELATRDGEIKKYQESEQKRLSAYLKAKSDAAISGALSGVKFLGADDAQKKSTRNLVAAALASRFEFALADDGETVTIKDRSGDRFVQEVPADLVRKEFSQLILSEIKGGPKVQVTKDADDVNEDDPASVALAAYNKLKSDPSGWL